MAETGGASEERAKSRNVRALSALWPFLKPYRAMLIAACLALISTAMISLILPLAVRRVVDGFETSAVELLDSYFMAALAIAMPPIRISTFRSAIEIDEPITLRISVVSVVIRLITSPVMIFS